MSSLLRRAERLEREGGEVAGVGPEGRADRGDLVAAESGRPSSWSVSWVTRRSQILRAAEITSNSCRPAATTWPCDCAASTKRWFAASGDGTDPGEERPRRLRRTRRRQRDRTSPQGGPEPPRATDRRHRLVSAGLASAGLGGLGLGGSPGTSSSTAGASASADACSSGSASSEALGPPASGSSDSDSSDAPSVDASSSASDTGSSGRSVIGHRLVGRPGLLRSPIGCLGHLVGTRHVARNRTLGLHRRIAGRRVLGALALRSLAVHRSRGNVPRRHRLVPRGAVAHRDPAGPLSSPSTKPVYPRCAEKVARYTDRVTDQTPSTGTSPRPRDEPQVNPG